MARVSSGLPFQQNNASLATGTDSITFPGKTQQVAINAIGADVQVSFDNQTTWFTVKVGTPFRMDIYTPTKKCAIKGTAAGSQYELLATYEPST